MEFQGQAPVFDLICRPRVTRRSKTGACPEFRTHGHSIGLYWSLVQLRLHIEVHFREDLYYQLNVFPIHVPPLRERREDISIMVSAFIQEFATAMGKRIESLARPDLESLERYSWPGNVRELRNVIERAVILAQGSKLKVELPISSVSSSSRSLTMQNVEREHIGSVLEMTGWRVRGKGGAAELLDMKPSTLRSRMAKLGLRQL